MGLEKLEYLLTVEETGSISKAAEILYMSQPSLSKSIASVESSIGCKIFQRTSTGLKRTTCAASGFYWLSRLKIQSCGKQDLI